MPFVIDRVSLPKTKKFVTVLCRAGLKYLKNTPFQESLLVSCLLSKSISQKLKQKWQQPSYFTKPRVIYSLWFIYILHETEELGGY